MSEAQYKLEIEKLRAENAALLAKANAKIQVRVSEKTGTVMVMGLQKFPVSLYADQWAKVFDMQDKIKAVCATAPVKADKAVG
jgi:pyridoxal biosynthesis lyase PdxS